MSHAPYSFFKGIWYHITAVFNSKSGQVIIFQDDEVIHDRTWEEDTGPILWGPYLSIGKRKYDNKMVEEEEFEGDMDSFEIYHTALKKDKIFKMADKCQFSVGSTILFYYFYFMLKFRGGVLVLLPLWQTLANLLINARAVSIAS